MGIETLNHFTVLSDDLEATQRFYALFGLTSGWRPPFGFPGLWLYAGEQAVLHVIYRDSLPDSRAGLLDHMAFTATDLRGVAATLSREGYDYDLRRVPASGLWQLFVRDPAGAMVEFDFDGKEPGPDGHPET